MTRQKNLNTAPLMKGKQNRKTHSNFYFRSNGIKIIGKESDMRECSSCLKILPATAFTTASYRQDGAYRLQKTCRECHTVIWKEQRDVRKNAPPEPNHCNCCHKKGKLEVDHIHGSITFRGWLCKRCNIGLGNLGDNLEGTLQAAVYLENDKDKIIKALHKVYDEMFARTNEEKF